MRRFTQLYVEMDRTTRTSEKVAALRRYFAEAPARDAAWALMCLSGQRLARTIATGVLRDEAARRTGLPGWLIDESYESVGDLSETIALVLTPRVEQTSRSLAEVFETIIVPMGRSDARGAAVLLHNAWDSLGTDELLVFHKLISGSFRVGVQRRLIVRAVAECAGIAPEIMAHRLSGGFTPTADAYIALLSPAGVSDTQARPYPFCLAHQLDDGPETLGEPQEWGAEWKWDGIRAQLIHREAGVFLWSRGEELINTQFPEVVGLGRALPQGVVLDGEVLAWGATPTSEGPLPFNDLQTRLNRKDTQPSLFEASRVIYMAFDVLEHGGEDIRAAPLIERRRVLETIVNPLKERGFNIRMSEQLVADSWEQVAEARQAAAVNRAAEGLMLKRLDSPYFVGRVRGGAGQGGWWKWKLNPYSVDAVLIYAQPGSGRRAGLYTDYTFGVWDEGRLVPFAKAYSGLTDDELRRVDAFVRASTLERHGPVRVVEPRHVFEIAFQEIHPSTRHRSGVAVRFPRIARWRLDKLPEQADTIEALRRLMRPHERTAKPRPRRR